MRAKKPRSVAVHEMRGFLSSWPRNKVRVESYIDPGFADYILEKSNGDNLLFIEAKRSGVFFTLPRPNMLDEFSCYIPIQLLMTDNNISDAMKQVRGYCVDSGFEFGCITNGHEWIFF